MIDPKDVIQRLSVEALCETADQYYRVVSDPTPLMSKPFASLHETPDMLQNLGLLLAGLHLGRTMTVLDFGAGTCWLSRYLCQLNCQPICCDTSPAALDIGRRLFSELPLIGTAVFKPIFLPFDGHVLELAAESMDRIICFDAFHHVPNQEEVLAEFGRVLKMGGIAGFSEPGQQHSQSPQSQYEMRTHQVLENDIDVHAIFELARPAGFTDLTLKTVVDRDMTKEEHRTLFGPTGPATEALKNELWNQTFNTMHSRAVFFLHKGPLQRDSRSHIGLAHRLSVDRTNVTVRRGELLRLWFTLTNTGQARWLHQHSEIFGLVRLASHLSRANGDLVSVDYSRNDLPQSVIPGETIQLAIEVPAPEPGDYRFTFDLVAEGVSWFENLGSRPVLVEVTVI